MNPWLIFFFGAVFGFIGALVFKTRVSESEYQAKLRADFCHEQLKAARQYIAEMEGRSHAD